MTATASPPAAPVAVDERTCLGRAEGIELLGSVDGCGYRHGAALVRRADGQMVQLGALMYAVLECADGVKPLPELAEAVSTHLGRRLQPAQVAKLAEKLARQGLLAGSEGCAPAKQNPLLALRCKVLVTNERITNRVTRPFVALLRPWIMWPVLALFAATLAWVLAEKGVASAAHQAFDKPELLLLIFALAVGSAGFHELGHAAAARYAGAKPGGMGMGLYMVWPAFYTDVTDAYRLPKKDRLRVDLAGLYFNAAVAVATMGVWLAVRADALLLLIGLQILQMVKQLSPIIRADGYHILSDWTGVPDLYAHMLPTLRRLLPNREPEPSALSGRARIIVTAWVLVVVPIMLSLALSAILLFPKVVTTAWESGREIGSALPGQVAHGEIFGALAGLLRLFALTLPVLGTALIAQKILRTTGAKAADWSRGRPVRRGLVVLGVLAGTALAAWAWWPAGQYQPIRASDEGTLGALTRLVASPASVARPQASLPAASSTGGARPAYASQGSGQAALAPGRHVAVAMIPEGGATKEHPALFVVQGTEDQPPVAILSPTAQAPPATASTATPSEPPATSPAGSSVVFPFKLPRAPGPGG